ncbi:MAG: FAD-dependent oxidoreductase [Gracilibacteraceae bacterium]|jgi:glycine/D-amino acid oxidase-like deaminating enzyme/nitrite reductase/ring-hydroxylating ferredoxin subunit|nr:FAD-dependent oxidoreductase [Gracilibacteraceae bacterium]
MEKDISKNNISSDTVPESLWMASSAKTNYPALRNDIKVDVAIVGGGITGITSAYMLKKEGFNVAVIEADRIIQGTTGHTTAKITSQHGLIYNKIKNYMGEEKARQYADANETAIGIISDLVEQEKIDCDFHEEPAYVYTLMDSYVQQIADEANTAAGLGIKSTFIENVPLPFKVKGAVKFDGQARFHPRKYLLALAKKVDGEGSSIFEHTRVVDINKGSPCVLVTNQGKKVTADNIVIASHFPCFDGMGFYFARMYPERSYALALKVKEKFSGGMYITAEDPGRSLRSQEYEGGELIIVGGEHHKTAHGTSFHKHYENLLEFANKHYDVQELLYRWSTQDYTTLDKIPYVGRLTSKTPNIYVATGFRKWGMTNSTVSAMILKDLILKGRNPWIEVYDPSRFVLNPSITSFVSINADVAAKLVSGKLKIVPEEIDVKKDEALIVDIDGNKMGVYRDNKEQLHVVDTTCTHMGCELKWNDAEKSWDCPCHGSRFTYEGEIIEGPAINELQHDYKEKNKIDPNIV